MWSLLEWTTAPLGLWTWFPLQRSYRAESRTAFLCAIHCYAIQRLLTYISHTGTGKCCQIHNSHNLRKPQGYKTHFFQWKSCLTKHLSKNKQVRHLHGWCFILAFFTDNSNNWLCPESVPELLKDWKPKDIEGGVEFWQEILSVLPEGHHNTELPSFLPLISAVTKRFTHLVLRVQYLTNIDLCQWMPRLLSSY